MFRITADTYEFENGTITESLTLHEAYSGGRKVQMGVITQALNMVDSFMFEILPNNDGYKKLKKTATWIKVFDINANRDIFHGRVITIDNRMRGDGMFVERVVCESRLGVLNDSIWRTRTNDSTVQSFLTSLLDRHNAEVVNNPMAVLQLGNINVAQNFAGQLLFDIGIKTFDAIFESLIGVYGGEIWLNGDTINYIVDPVKKSNVEIRLAKNLKTLTLRSETGGFFTRLVVEGGVVSTSPDGLTTRLSLRDGNFHPTDYVENADDVKEFGVITEYVTFDEFTEISQLPQLLESAKNYLESMSKKQVQYIVDALDLSRIGLETESFELGTYYPVINNVMGIDDDLRVVKKQIDIITPSKSKLTMGDMFMTSTQHQDLLRNFGQRIRDLRGGIGSLTRREVHIDV